MRDFVLTVVTSVIRLKSDGLINADQLFTVEEVEQHHSYTSVHVQTNINQIHDIGLKYIAQLEEILRMKEELL